MCIYILIYLMISVTISYSMKEHGQEEFSKVSVKIAVENLDQGELGAGLVSYLGQHHQLQELPETRLALQDAMYYQEIDYVLAIPKDFTEKFQTGQQEGILEGTMVPGSRAASFMEQEIQQYLNIVLPCPVCPGSEPMCFDRGGLWPPSFVLSHSSCRIMRSCVFRGQSLM